MKFTAASGKKDRYATSPAHFTCISTQATPQWLAEYLYLEVSWTAKVSYVKCHGSVIGPLMVAGDGQAVAARGVKLWQFSLPWAQLFFCYWHDPQKQQQVRLCCSPLGGSGRNICLCLVYLIGRSPGLRRSVLQLMSSIVVKWKKKMYVSHIKSLKQITGVFIH